jgi:glycosyltransferase involved in cell wall biosynthesis
MKILIDARLYGLEHAGLGRYTLNLIEELRLQGTKDEFIILLRKRYFDKLNFPNNWKKVLTDFRHYSYKEQIMLPIILYKEKADIVHFLHFNVPILYFGKYIVTIHDLLMHKFVGGAVTTLPFPLYQLRRVGYNLAFMKAIKSSKKIIVPTNFVKKDLIREYKINPDKLVVTHEGITSFGDEGSETREERRKTLDKYKIIKPYFFYVGNAYPHKNLESAVDAVVDLNKNSKSKTSLVIAGSRDVFKERLGNYLDKVNALDYVKLLGYVPDRDLKKLIKNSTAFVYPSLSEGFGLQGLEAMLAGTPLIASDIEVFREIYKNNAIYFNPNDIDDIVCAMKTVMKMTSKKRTHMIKEGKKYIKRYSWSKMTKKTLKVYREAVREYIDS